MKNIINILGIIIIIAFIGFLYIFVRIIIADKNAETTIKIYEKLQEERNNYLEKSILFLENTKDCSMNSSRKIFFLNIIFNKSLEYRNRFYIKPSFVLYHIRQESGFNEKALGSHGEKTIFQYHPLKLREACLIYKISEEDFTSDLEKQIDFYFILMTEYLRFYTGDIDKALLTYNCGEGIIEAYKGDVDYLKKVVYIDNKVNPRKPYSDIILEKYNKREKNEL